MFGDLTVQVLMGNRSTDTTKRVETCRFIYSIDICNGTCAQTKRNIGTDIDLIAVKTNLKLCVRYFPRKIKGYGITRARIDKFKKIVLDHDNQYSSIFKVRR